jgi:hypothetical protein
MNPCFQYVRAALARILATAWPLLPALMHGQVTGGMVNPDVDVPGEPFSYFMHPTDVVGVIYDPVASEVTPEGYVYTGSGEMMFYIGNSPEAIEQRVKTLDKGFLPAVHYTVRRDGLEYSFTIWADDLGAGLKGLPVNFARVEISNRGSERHAGFISSAYRFEPPNQTLHGGPGIYRFIQRFDRMPEQFTAGQTKFNPEWKYGWGEDSLVRDQRSLYFFPSTPKYFRRSLGLEDNGLRMERFFTGEVEGNRDPKYTLRPSTSMGVVMYRVSLAPGERQELVFKMPIIPVGQDSAEARQIRNADAQTSYERMASAWTTLVGDNPPVVFPEEKVQQYLLANTVFDLMAIDKVADDYIQNINKFQYHDPYGGATSINMLIASLYSGLNEPAKNGLLYFRKMQQPDGKFIMDNHPDSLYWELFGYTLWGWNRYYQLTRDDDFLRQVYPGVVAAMAWQKNISDADPLGLMPISTISDDAYLKDTYQTGMNMWVLDGLKNAIEMADALGKKEDAESFKTQYATFRAAFDKQLKKQTDKSGGYIPAGLNRTLLGNEWDNLLTLYPDQLFDPFDPRVTATLQKARSTYVEGILGYDLPRATDRHGDEFDFDTQWRLHYWQDPDNSENELIRDDPEDQELVVRDLYALLLHTSSTHAPQEFGTYPWSTRDYVAGDILPDGSSSSKTIELLRNMLVREAGNDLYLFSAISPAWIEQGKSIEVHGEQTNFGPVTATLKSAESGLQVSVSNRFRQAPAHIVIPVPWFYEATSAEADGRAVKIVNGTVTLSPGVHQVTLHGRPKPQTRPMSFNQAVKDYQDAYRAKYKKFLQTGELDLSEPQK